MQSLQSTLAAAFDGLLSIRTTTSSTAVALSSLERLLAALAFENTNNHLESFLRLQDGFEYNLTSRLLESLARSVIHFENAHDREGFESTRSNVGRTLALIQGLLLLHRPSQRLFARRSTLECLLAILKIMQPNPLGSPAPSPAASSSAFPLPSPTPSTSSFANSKVTGTSVSLGVLDVLLCALVDRSRNIRTFEEVGGLKAVVTILKDKNVVKSVRIKVIEILYYYLLPEPIPHRRTVSTSSSIYEGSATLQPIELPDLLDNALGGFIPQTPVKSRPSHRRNSSSISFASGGSEGGREERNHRRNLSGRSVDSIVEDTSSPDRRRDGETSMGGEDEDGTPRAAAPKFHLPLNSPRRRPHSSTSTSTPSTPSTISTPSRRSGLDTAASPTPALQIRPIPPSPTPSSIESGHDQATRVEGRIHDRKRREGSNEEVNSREEKRDAPEAKETIRRTESEKKELLREVLGNVDALEERFKNIALGLRS